MAEDSYPAPARNEGIVTVVESQELLGLLAGVGVIGGGDLLVTTSTSQSQVNVAAGTALLMGTRYTNSASLPVSVPVNTSGSTRIDRIVLRLTTATGAVNATVIPGTPGSGAPGVLNSATYFDLPLARYTVLSGQLPTAPVDERRWLGGDSTISASSNPPVGNIRIGHTWSQPDTGNMLTWDGSVWDLNPGNVLTTAYVTSDVSASSSYVTILALSQVESHGGGSVSGYSMMAPVAGLYRVNVMQTLTYTGSTVLTSGQAFLYVRRNSGGSANGGTLEAIGYFLWAGGAGTVTVYANQLVRCAAGDYLQFFVECDFPSTTWRSGAAFSAYEMSWERP